MAKMNCGTIVLFCSCVLISIINQAARADKEDTASEELMEEEYRHSSAEVNGTLEELSFESHEAMTKGGEFKPKFSTATTTTMSSTNREKRSYEFLLGLVNNNSRFQVTNTEDDTRIPRRDKVLSKDLGASELLLEMMVKIAAHPEQWEQVHNLLQKIDNDLKTSKSIVNTMQTSLMKNNDKDKITASKDIEINKKLESRKLVNLSTTRPFDDIRVNKHLGNDTVNSTTVQTTTISNENGIYYKTQNDTDEALKTNQWSYGRISKKPPEDLKDDGFTTKYPWQVQTKSVKSTYPRNFAYHRVTGNPLYHTNVNSNPKAYIAVSVIAPKPIKERPTDDDLVLENELRELKPWTHNQNLKNMASLRSRWVIQSDQAKP